MRTNLFSLHNIKYLHVISLKGTEVNRMKNKNMILKVLTSTLIISLIVFNSLVIFAEPINITVEGEGNYFVTGESYPTMIQIAGYNSRDNKLYINSDFVTNKTVEAAEAATFNYYIEIFNGLGTELGNLGSYDVPDEAIAAVGETTVSIVNEEISLTSPLTAENRTVITIKSVIIQ